MKRITDIAEQKKDKKRVNLYLDGEFFSGMEKIVVLSENLHIGDFVSEDELGRLLEESEYTSAFERASGYIAKSNHTCKEVVLYLLSKGYGKKVVRKVIDKLKSYGYIDDLLFARSYYELKSSVYGKRMIRVMLMKKGVPDEVIEQVVDESSDDDKEDERAYNVAVKYVKGKPFDIVMKQKCFRYIVSKGFSFDSAKYAVERFENETSGSD